MKVFGYKQKDCAEEGLMQMQEVTFSASSAVLRNLAKFFSSAADDMDKMGKHFDHIHAQDTLEEWQDKWPDIIIVKRE